ncbi:MAG: PTS sugar transporter subunit IIA [Phycisphaerae bacterium]
MPREQMNAQQVAAYLHMDLREVNKLASRGKIPCRRVGGEFIFTKGDVDHWVENQLPDMDRGRLEGIVAGVSKHHGFEHEMLVTDMIPDGGLAVPLLAKTKQAVIRSLVDLADEAGLVWGRDDLIDELLAREEMCTTAIAPGIAIPHPRHPLPYDISESFVVAGVTASGIPYGAEDGSLTRAFFLVCCKDDRTHLHVLARLARMLYDNHAIDDVLHVEDADQLRAKLLQHEKAVVD